MGTPLQSHIKNLFQAGIATHVVSNTTDVDPIFALSKVHDFPQISFAAAFDDGRILLGCHGDLPEPLSGLAQPILIEDDAEQDSPPDDALADIHTKLDAVTALIDQQVQANTALQDRLDLFETTLTTAQTAITSQQTDVKDGEDDTALADTRHKLDALLDQHGRTNAALQERFDRFEKTLTNSQPEVAEINALFARIQRQLETPPDMAALTAPLQQVSDDLTTAVSQLNATSQDSPADAIATALDGFEQRLRDQMATFADSQALEAVRTDIAAQHATLSVTMIETLAAQSSQQNELPDAIAQQARFDELANQISMLQGIDAKLADIADTVHAMGHALDATPVQPAIAHDQLSQQINDLAIEVSAVAQRPDPVLDLTEQRRGLALFQTAMRTVLHRLETETERLASIQPQTADPAIAELPHQIAMLTEHMGSIAPLQENLRRIDTALKEQPAQIEGIATAVSALGQRPDPVLDLTEQRRLLANFASALGQITTRLENVAGRIDQDTTKADILARLDAMLTHEPEDASANAVMDILEHQKSEIASLRTAIMSLVAQPAPTLDLTQQRASFAQFGTALGTVVARFEGVAARIESVARGNTDTTSVDEPEIEEEEVEYPPIPAKTSFADEDISLDGLRQGLAELIAKQIMDNAKSGLITPNGDTSPKH